MVVALQPWKILVASLAGWITRQQDAVIEYLREESGSRFARHTARGGSGHGGHVAIATDIIIHKRFHFFPAALPALIVMVLAGAGCSDGGTAAILGGGDADPPDAVDVAGDWTFTVNIVDPVQTVECTGDLADELFSFCNSFDVTLVQDGAVFESEAPTETFCDSTITMSGVATVDTVTGVIVVEEEVNESPLVVETMEIEFTAVTISNSATFAMVRLTVAGLGGECLMGGSYLGQRTAVGRMAAR